MREVDKFEIPTGHMMRKFNAFINDNLNALLEEEIKTYAEYLQLAR